MRGKDKVRSLGEVLHTLFDELQAGNRMKYGEVFACWKECVGQRIAEQTCPAHVRNGVLHVNVTSSSWLQQLHYMRDRITEKLNSRLSSPGVQDIRFRIGHVPRARPPEHGEPPPLSPDQQKTVERQSAGIADIELQEAFRSVMKAYLKNRREGD